MLADLRRLRGHEWVDHYDATLSDDYGAIPLVSLDGRTSGKDAQLPVGLDEYDRYRPTELLGQLPYFAKLLDYFQCPKGRTRIMKLAPGASIGAHRVIANEVACFAFNHVRLHIPIVTNDKVFFFVGNQRLHMMEGRLYYVNFVKKHHVRNDGAHHRIHLVMDLRVNDWLRNIFPPLSFLEAAENSLYRAALPPYWSLLKARGRLERRFWQNYEGSTAQKLLATLRGR